MLFGFILWDIGVVLMYRIFRSSIYYNVILFVLLDIG